MNKVNPVKRVAKRSASPEKVHSGSGNVFADLGLPNAEEHLAKADLAHTLCELIAAAGLTQQAAAERLGIDQPKVSALMRGKLQDFSTDRLMRFVTALDRDVVITIGPPKDKRRPIVRVVASA